SVHLAPTPGFRQILVTPDVRADGVAGGRHLLEDAGLVGGMQADWEEDRLSAMRGERGENCRGGTAALNRTNPLHRALERLGALLESRKGAAPDGAAKGYPM